MKEFTAALIYIGLNVLLVFFTGNPIESHIYGTFVGAVTIYILVRAISSLIYDRDNPLSSLKVLKEENSSLKARINKLNNKSKVHEPTPFKAFKKSGKPEDYIKHYIESVSQRKKGTLKLERKKGFFKDLLKKNNISIKDFANSIEIEYAQVYAAIGGSRGQKYRRLTKWLNATDFNKSKYSLDELSQDFRAFVPIRATGA